MDHVPSVPEKPKATLHLSHHDHPSVKGMKVGSKVKFHLHGKVTRVDSSDGEGGKQHNATIEIENLEDKPLKDKSYPDVIGEMMDEEKKEGLA